MTVAEAQNDCTTDASGLAYPATVHHDLKPCNGTYHQCASLYMPVLKTSVKTSAHDCRGGTDYCWYRLRVGSRTCSTLQLFTATPSPAMVRTIRLLSYKCMPAPKASAYDCCGGADDCWYRLRVGARTCTMLLCIVTSSPAVRVARRHGPIYSRGAGRGEIYGGPVSC